MTDAKTILMFDASLQRDVPHTIDIDGNGEIVITSVESGRFIKLPKETDAAGLRAYIETHKAANEGQVSQESLDAKKAELLDALVPSETEAQV